MADQGDSPTTGLVPGLDTAHSSTPNSPELSVISSHGDLVTEPLSPLQDHSPTLSDLSGRASSLSEWDFVFKAKSKQASTLSFVRSVISFSSDGCDYPELISPASSQAAKTSVVATASSKVESSKVSADLDVPTLPREIASRGKKRAMPYNNTAIPPSEEITGSTALPLARVKRILQVDEDISACSNSAAFAITVATEMFVRYMAEKALDVVKSERKPRRNIQYKDVANAVARFDNLEFLSDVVPKTITYGEHKRRKAEKEKRKRELQNGQTTLNASRSLPKRQTEVIDVDKEFPDEQDESVDPPINGHVQAGPSHINGNGNLMKDHETHEGSHHGGSEDVEMN